MRILEQRPVPVIPLALQNLWGSFFSRVEGAAMTQAVPARAVQPRRPQRGPALAPEAVTPEGLHQRGGPAAGHQGRLNDGAHGAGTGRHGYARLPGGGIRRDDRERHGRILRQQRGPRMAYHSRFRLHHPSCSNVSTSTVRTALRRRRRPGDHRARRTLRLRRRRRRHHAGHRHHDVGRAPPSTAHRRSSRSRGTHLGNMSLQATGCKNIDAPDGGAHRQHRHHGVLLVHAVGRVHQQHHPVQRRGARHAAASRCRRPSSR